MQSSEMIETRKTETKAGNLKIALLTGFAVLMILLLLSSLFNITLYCAVKTALFLSFGISATFGFLDLWPFSYVITLIFVLLALVLRVLPHCEPMTCTWYLWSPD